MAELSDKQPAGGRSDGSFLSPVQRDCTCLLRAPSGPHIADCNRRFRAKLFSAWRAERLLFYGR